MVSGDGEELDREHQLGEGDDSAAGVNGDV